MEFLITYIITIITTYIIDMKRTNKMFKDIADNGYKIDIEKYSECNNSDDSKSLRNLIFLFPFLNICFSVYVYLDYINNREENFNMLRVTGAIKEMDKKESYIYDTNPKGNTAITISVGSKEEINSLYKDALALEEAKQIRIFTKKIKRKEISQEELIINIMDYYQKKYPDVKDASEHIKNITPEEIIYIYNMCCENQDDVEYIYDDEENIKEEKGFTKVKKR